MTRPMPFARALPATDPRLALALRHWLLLGAAAVLLLPAARGASAWLGSLPFWLVLAPLAALAVHHRHALVAAWRAHLVSATPRRRRRSRRAQARRLGMGLRFIGSRIGFTAQSRGA